METQTEYLHFRVGSDIGAILTQIAIEHLTMDKDPVKAIKVFTESLHGCTEAHALAILTGKYVIVTDEETQTCGMAERTEEHKDFPRIDPMWWIQYNTREIKEHSEGLHNAFNMLQSTIQRNYRRFSFDFDYDDIFKFIAGKDEAILDKLYENTEVDGIANLFNVTKSFIENSAKVIDIMGWMIKSFDDFGGEANAEAYQKALSYLYESKSSLDDLKYVLNETVNFDFSIKEELSDTVSSYIEAIQNNDIIISKGIEPVNIMDKYDAGWLSPEGDFYGLNGTIANMLHNQIADALQEKGLIPMYANDKDEEIDVRINPDEWLEQQGWVKVHDNNINFAGCLNEKFGKKNVNMTAIQIKKLYEYLSICHDCKVRLGWKMEKVSSTMFRDLAENNPDLLNERYFEF